MNEEISNGRITLKRDSLSFIEKLFEAIDESRIPEFIKWMPWLTEGFGIEDLKHFKEKRIAAWDEGEEYTFVIFDSVTDKVLGRIDLNDFVHDSKFCNLGYWVRVSEQRRGIASEAIQLLVKQAFESLPINRIEIRVATGNMPSQKAAEKAGATREGILRKRLLIGEECHDAVMYSFIKNDFY